MEEKSDSDSANSLFLTQSVTSALTTVKSLSDPQECPFSQPSEAEQKTAQRGVPTAKSDSDSETSVTDLLRRWRSPTRTRGRIRRRRRPRHQRVAKTIEFPFLKKFGSGKLSIRKKHTIVNSEIGGFFKCLQKLSKGHGEKSRRELSPSMLPSDWEKEDSDEDEDIRKVDMDRFIFGANKRNRQTWLPLLKRKTRKFPEESKTRQDQQVKSFKTRKMAEDPIESQDSTDITSESGSSSEEEPLPRKRGEKSGKPSTKSSVSLRSTTSRTSPGKSSFVQSLFMDPQKKHIENQPQVLVQCSQSQSLDRQQTQKAYKAPKNLMKPTNEMAVQETQWPSSDQDEDETQILENNPTDDSGEDFGGDSGGFLRSQDLFQEPDNQASPSKANEKVLGSRVALNDIMKNKRGSFISADNYVNYAKAQSSEIISPAAGDIDQERKDKGKMTLGDISVAHMYPFIFESRVVLHDVMKNKRGSFISADNYVNYAKAQSSEIISPAAGDIDQERKDKGKMTLGDISVAHMYPFIFKSRVVLHDVMKHKNKRCLLVLADMKADRAKYSEMTQTCKISPKARDIDQEREEKDQKTSDDISVEHVPPSIFESSMALHDTMKDDHAKYSKSEMTQTCKISPKPRDIDQEREEKDKKTSDDISVEHVPPSIFESSVLRDIMKDDHAKYSKSQLTQSSEILPTAGDIHQEKDKKTSDDISVEHVPPSIFESSVLRDIMKDDHAKYSKSQLTQSSEILPTAGDIHQEKDKKTSDDISVEPIKDSTTGNNYSSPFKDVLSVRQEKKMDSPRFNYGGMTFLKRKKGKKTEAPGLNDNPPPIQADPDQNEGSAPHIDDPIMPKKSRNVQNDGLSENPTDTLPEIRVRGEIIKDGTGFSAPVSGIEPKQKTKEDKNDGLLAEPVDTLPEMSVSADSVQSVQDISVVCPSVGENTSKKMRKKDKNDGLLEEPDDIMHEINDSADINRSVQDSLVDCSSVGRSKPKKKRKKDKHGEPVPNGDQLTGEETIQIPGRGPASLLSITKETKQLTGNDYPSHELNQLDSRTQAHDDLVHSDGLESRKKKKKKMKKRDSSPEMADAMVASQCSEEMSVSAHSNLSVQDSSVDCASNGGSKPKKKRKKDKNDERLAEPVNILQQMSISAASASSVQDSLVDCASVGGSKPKKKKKKMKKRDSSPEMADAMVASQCSEEISVSAHSNLSVQDSSVDCASVGGSKPKKKRKRDINAELLEDPVQEISVSADPVLPIEDFASDCASNGGSKPKKKRKKDKNDERLAEPVDILQQMSISAASASSVQDSLVDCASVGGSKPKKKRKKDRSAEPEEEEAIQIPCPGSASLVSITEETVQLTGNAVNQLDIHTQVHHVQSDGPEPRRKKKKKKRDSSLEMTNGIVASQCSEESYLSQGTKTVKKKKQTFIDDVGQVEEVPKASKSLEEPSDKTFDIPAGVEIHPVTNVDLTTNISGTPRKKKKKKRKAVREENVDAEASSVAIQEQVQTQDAEEVVQEKKVKKQKKKKKHRSETTHEEEADASPSLGPELRHTPRSNTPSARSESGRTGEEEGLAKSKSAKKKKKKKRKELDSDGWSVSHGSEYMDDSYWHNTDETARVKEGSSGGRYHHAACSEMQLANNRSEGTKREGAKSDGSESSQVLQSEDPIPLKRRKKKKKKSLVEPDIDMCREIVERDIFQENGSPSETSEATIKKKKKKRKDTDAKCTRIRSINKTH